MLVNRRHLLAGAASLLATQARAEAPLTSIRPRARLSVNDPAARLIARANLSGSVGCVVADLATGEVREAIKPDAALPPASVTKAVTALYAIEALGAAHQFETRVIAAGPILDGVLDGDLILVGGGDPNLVTDQLADLAEQIKAAGLREVKGDFFVWDNALVNLDEIDNTQLDHVGYNPAVTGLNLNFNRVHFEWKREGAKYTTALDARSEKYRPAVTTARVSVVDRQSPVFTYQERDGVDDWTVARRALNNGGSRWLPVRRPALYAGEVFATFARSHGIVLKRPQELAELPQGRALAVWRSAPLDQMMRSMLRFSTNITAEAAGLSATAALTGTQRGLRTSALGMARWAGDRAGIQPHFVDHSGLGDESRVSAADMVSFLSADGAAATLRPLMKRIQMVDANRKVVRNHLGHVQAKTGTLNFVSSLAGYVRTSGGQDLAFAFFGADLEKREQGKRAGDESPAGARQWNRQAKALQQRLLQHWIKRGA
ncbi:D-alanyl-D-alanine carboxypeptidase/D-alanyl-D-alanine endopeptidase [Yoonia sediminilitoris]|uniref:D-alanyl-D-alanine carboxypeptidase/D-alanyl-D-alanine-endopeptidase (Penicillin-binding protein 4) n=1 Tax=Yoonia sediminilitoris TaxID=1286148 RepID=A0A2T6KPW9_9RHOB|nr:D-alanyl-D-alanine carboxypeptidase/D-alanyl-D-alanine-endopeptidase [Yoonia sediminilitoris]PUB18588.1 D-alanyl-D-alanine carboxypeptidase/D-alanyl-D-alanine-endopeptidase (penicillin-binding protein 4) [Yoonia sediminilitoris]RCW98756.1 D-alanyl-D-alanine carboxypeptidase/D-alanyl-D-alanine-endopeptidase (penicillin-binding protein 4) [Yoonia sediminilitoris]